MSNLGRKLLDKPYALWAVLFVLAPLCMVVYYAFTDTGGAFSLHSVSQIPSYLSTILLSVLYGLAATVICLLLGYPFAYFIARSRESLRLGQLFDYLHQHLAASHTVASLAQRAGMGTRTFLRRFEEATGKTPARWLLDERLLRARQHLTESTMGIDQIAERCGFASAGTLRHHFRQHFALSPLQYRKQFTPSPIAKPSQPRTIDGHSKPVARRVDDEERVSGSDL